MTVFLLQVSAKTNAQNITLKRDQASLKSILQEIRKQTGYTVLYETKQLDKTTPVSVNFKETPLKEALTKILDDQGLAFSIEDKAISIKPKEKSLLDNLYNYIVADDIKGRVLDETGEPLPSASVVVKGTKTITRTDKNGAFVIAADKGAVLVISFIGYDPYEYTVKDKSEPVVIRMKVSTMALKDVVVTGIFERSAKTYTGSANTITANDIRKVGNQNVLGVLGVLDPSVQIPQDILNGSDPNKMAQIRLRGTSSLPTNTIINPMSKSNLRNEKDYYSAYGKSVDEIKNTYTVNPNLPLFVLDGFEVSISQINDLDITLIQSITILKDASATAIYGSRGASGVIVVERVKPPTGQLRFNYKLDLTVELPDLHDYKLLNSRQKLEAENLAGVYNTGFTDMDQNLKSLYNERYKEVLRGRDTYWPSLPLENTLSQRHGLTMDGGSDRMTYGLDFTYNDRNGVMKGSDRTSYNGGIYLNFRGDKFLLSNRLSLQYTNATNSPWGSFSQYVKMNPYFSPYDQNGNVLLYLQRKPVSFQGEVYGDIYNPVYNTTLNGKDFRKTGSLINNTAITYNFNRDLSIRGRLSLTSQNNNSEVFLPADHTIFRALNTSVFERGSYTSGYGKLFSYDANIDLNYNRKLGKSQIYSTFSARANQNSNENVIVQVNGLPSALTDYVFYGRKYVNDRPSGSESTVKSLGFLGNVNYSYDNRYFADFSYRLDGSSGLGSDRLFAPFWSVGAGWNIHNEAFAKQLLENGTISQIKLRGSTGLTGAQQFDPYMAYRTYNYFLNESYGSTIGASLLSIGNESLTWQSTMKYNVGADITLFKNRLMVNADYYYDYTDKFIADFNLPLSTGFETYKGNLGSLGSHGWELRSSFQAITAANFNDFSLMLMGNIGSNNTKVKKISNELKAQNEKLFNSVDNTSPFQRYEEGKSLDAIWVVPSLGIDPATGHEMFLKKDGTSTFTWDAKDMVSFGVSNPKYRGSLGASMAYKGLQLTTYFSYRFGGQYFNQTLLNRIENVNLVDNADVRVLTERWKQAGDIAYFKSIAIAGAKTKASSRFVQDDNTLEMTSLSLLYRIDPSKLKSLKLRNLNFGVYANNLFRLSSIQMERGLDYPFTRSFSVSIQTGF
ncbi:SusC/RagA family TonB-linked outer membrane protein [Pedobacter gandavensis]|uniref:SusC/RagA family TonB-linked outer membrane protein n=1 Tax=Pedobacter gandavensis TaxID=2679963 RepID=UPI002930B709|nr:SusC/RagA family TonB-linked outer membrane protein [Pedobacter gandavensis]